MARAHSAAKSTKEEARLMPFTHFVAVDWSGAKGCRHTSIAVAVCEAGARAPTLVKQATPWSREGVLEWLSALAADRARPLIGFDFSFAPPFDLESGYFRHGDAVPKTAKDLWAYVNARCDDEDFGAASFVEHTHRKEFYLGKRDGVKASYMRLRECEKAFNASGGGKPSSIFDAIGASQVCKASFAGMRLLHHAQAHFPVWPQDAYRDDRGLIVEIYTRAFIQHAGLRGLKVRERSQLNVALKALDSGAYRGRISNNAQGLSDHETDALITAAGLRKIHREPSYWSPMGLTPAIAQREGWTFGVA
jgi:hypothetical protein